MRVLLFTPFVYPFHVDIVIYLSNFVNIKLFTCGIYGNYPFQDLLKYAEKVECIDVMGQKIPSISSLLKIIRWKPHAAIIFGIESLVGITIYYLVKLMKRPVLVIVEENNVTRVTKAILRSLQKVKMLIIRHIYSTADVLVAESTASIRYVKDILQVKRSKPSVVKPHGINLSMFLRACNTSKEEARAYIATRYHLPRHVLNKKLWIAFIGEPSYYKGADVFIDALFNMMQSGEKITEYAVVLWPKLPLLRDNVNIKKEYLRKLAMLIVRNITALYPPISLSDMPVFYKAVDIVVLPSRFLKDRSSDRSPNVALEALACGKILIASYTGGIPDIADNCAIFVKPNDSIDLAKKLINIILNKHRYDWLEEKAVNYARRKLNLKPYSLQLIKLLIGK